MYDSLLPTSFNNHPLGFLLLQITSNDEDDGEYVPISPTPKDGYAVRIRLRNYHEWYSLLEKYWYLKIGEYYEVPVQMLDAVINRVSGRSMTI